jgi:hypothetical protein
MTRKKKWEKRNKEEEKSEYKEKNKKRKKYEYVWYKNKVNSPVL